MYVISQGQFFLMDGGDCKSVLLMTSRKALLHRKVPIKDIQGKLRHLNEQIYIYRTDM